MNVIWDIDSDDDNNDSDNETSQSQENNFALMVMSFEEELFKDTNTFND
jgi:hypothetical protein